MKSKMKHLKIINYFLCLIVLSICCISCVRNIETSDYKTNDIFLVDLPQINKTNQRIYYVGWGKLTNNSYNDSVMVFSDANNSLVQTNIYFVVNIADKILTYNIGRWDTVVLQNGSLELIDCDGDGIDEILLHMEVTANGGTITQIFKVQNGSIILWDNVEEKDLNITSSFANDYMLIMENNKIGFSYSMDIQNEFIPDYFDDNGEGMGIANVSLSPIESCVIENVVEDGRFVLSCSRNVKVTNYCGKIITKFQYNNESKSLELFKIEFVPKSTPTNDQYIIG